ncbi:Citrate transporter [Carpediemonas membranifera]|uniref:Citrate transporter n=1 Tax=Carpediemonas membranifera TaxID=201153 RepID=A0A8J6AQY2_9EUKA|nr:Citrate transporter [Carpediemonas membranifera]|eukprot:KAG9389855.1 Citrate transporter [Carpediemonas membranifera]
MKFAKSLQVASSSNSYAYIDYKKLKKLVQRSMHEIEVSLGHKRHSRSSSFTSKSFDFATASLPNSVPGTPVPAAPTQPPVEILALDTLSHFTRCVEVEREKVKKEYARICAEMHHTLEQYTLDAKAIKQGDESQMEIELFRTQLFIFACHTDHLIEYGHMNREGFRKICKKFDKLVTTPMLEKYEVAIEPADAIYHRILEVEEFATDEQGPLLLNETAALYASIIASEQSEGEEEEDSEQVAAFFLEEVAKHHAYRHNPFDEGLKAFLARAQARLPAEQVGLTKKGLLILPIALIVAGVIPFLPLPFDDDQQDAQRALALLVLSLILWATSAIPLFATSILILVTAVLLQIFDSNAESGSTSVYQAMVSDNTILVIIGFALNASLRRHHIDVPISRLIARCSLGKPWLYILVLMSLTFFLSMWLSSVAAPMLVISLVLPTIRLLPESSKFGRTILMAVCLSANIGGMGTPIASPQSALALDALATSGYGTEITFVGFMLVSVPVSIVLVLFSYAYVMLLYRPDVASVPRMVDVDPTDEAAVHEASKQGKPSIIGVVGTAAALVIAVALWASTSFTGEYIGRVGIISLVPIFILFGLGLVSKQDYVNLPWDVVTLLAGGSVLGAAIKQTELLHILIDPFQSTLHSMPGFLVIILAGLLMFVAGNVISHTVAALIVLPFVAEISKDFHPAMAVLLCSFVNSNAILLPVSSFPNISSLSVEDANRGRPFLKPLDLLIGGSIEGPFACLVIFTMGALLAYVVGY